MNNKNSLITFIAIILVAYFLYSYIDNNTTFIKNIKLKHYVNKQIKKENERTKNARKVITSYAYIEKKQQDLKIEEEKIKKLEERFKLGLEKQSPQEANELLMYKKWGLNNLFDDTDSSFGNEAIYQPCAGFCSYFINQKCLYENEKEDCKKIDKIAEICIEKYGIPKVSDLISKHINLEKQLKEKNITASEFKEIENKLREDNQRIIKRADVIYNLSEIPYIPQCQQSNYDNFEKEAEEIINQGVEVQPVEFNISENNKKFKLKEKNRKIQESYDMNKSIEKRIKETKESLKKELEEDEKNLKKYPLPDWKQMHDMIQKSMENKKKNTAEYIDKLEKEMELHTSKIKELEQELLNANDEDTVNKINKKIDEENERYYNESDSIHLEVI